MQYDAAGGGARHQPVATFMICFAVDAGPVETGPAAM